MALVKSALKRVKKTGIEFVEGPKTHWTAKVGDTVFAIMGHDEDHAIFDMRVGGDSVLYSNPTIARFISYIEDAKN